MSIELFYSLLESLGFLFNTCVIIHVFIVVIYSLLESLGSYLVIKFLELSNGLFYSLWQSLAIHSGTWVFRKKSIELLYSLLESLRFLFSAWVFR